MAVFSTPARKASLKILQRISLENDIPTVSEQHG